MFELNKNHIDNVADKFIPSVKAEEEEDEPEEEEEEDEDEEDEWGKEQNQGSGK
jgi:hypothetical protein